MKITLKVVNAKELDFTEILEQELGVNVLRHLDSFIFNIEENMLDKMKSVVNHYQTTGAVILVNID